MCLTVDATSCYTLFPREMASVKRAQIFHSDGPGGVLLISNNRDDRMRAYCLKQNHPKSLDQNLTPKNRTPNFRATKISRGTKHPGYEGTITNLQIVLNTQKNRCLNQATQKNTCQNFPEQKIPKSKISNAKNSFNHPCRLKYGVHPSPLPLGLMARHYPDQGSAS